MAVISMTQLLEAGAHFGHQAKRWNPKMKPYIYAERNGIHILDLKQTLTMTEKAYDFVREIASEGGKVLFVGTKKQAQDAVKDEALRCGGFYVNQRWLGGLLTNLQTIKSRVKRLNELERNGIHILDLKQTLTMTEKAYDFVREIASEGGKVLFVGTKKQAQDAVKDEALRCGGFYVNQRWLGGLLTNLQTIKSRVKRLNELEEMDASGELDTAYTKKEASLLRKELAKLEKNVGGIKGMSKLPAALFVVDIKKEFLALQEAAKLGIPVIALIDTNVDPDLVTYKIPANDDAIRSVALFASVIANAVIEGQGGAEGTETLEETEEVKEETTTLSEDEVMEEM